MFRRGRGSLGLKVVPCSARSLKVLILVLSREMAVSKKLPELNCLSPGRRGEAMVQDALKGTVESVLGGGSVA